MVRGLGVDIVEIERLRRSMGRTAGFVQRVFAPDEVAYCESMADPARHFAARFAAKEAVMKALGTGWSGGVTFRDIEVEHPESGPPEVRLSGRSAERFDEMGGQRILLSLSHEKSCAVATALIEGAENGA